MSFVSGIQNVRKVENLNIIDVDTCTQKTGFDHCTAVFIYPFMRFIFSPENDAIEKLMYDMESTISRTGNLSVFVFERIA